MIIIQLASWGTSEQSGVIMIEKFSILVVLLFLIVVFGVWVSRAGKPYNGVLFNIHKLIALGGVILTAVRLLRMDPLETFPDGVLFLIGISILAVIVLFSTGAVMSIQSEVNTVYRWLHGLGLAIAAGSFAAGLLLLGGG